ncbi:MAG: hypothetical protein U5L72_03180 [Bacteroidales bacterium]|nr:hypothetical protein [Bacteroidales bacterium]
MTPSTVGRNKQLLKDEKNHPDSVNLPDDRVKIDLTGKSGSGGFDLPKLNSEHGQSFFHISSSRIQ